MANNALNKGKRGEKEALAWLLKKLPIESLHPENITRLKNIGDDIELIHFSIEVKRREILDIDDWWYQCIVNADKKEKEPILMFRQNRKNWRFIISARNLGLQRGWIEISESAFIEFATNSIEAAKAPFIQNAALSANMH